MIRPDPTLGRRRGVYMPIAELQALEVCGWILIDDLAGMTPARDENGEPLVLMQPPQVFEREGKAA